MSSRGLTPFYGRSDGDDARGDGPRGAFELAMWLARLAAFAVAALLLIGLIYVTAAFVLGRADDDTLSNFGAAAARSVGPVCAWVLFLVLILALLTGLRRRRDNAVLAYLQQATALNLPLPAMLRAAERAESFGTARALLRLRLELEGGQSVRDAVAVALPAMPARTIGLVGAAERSGRLAQALSRLTREGVARFGGGRPGTDLYLRWYPPTIGLVLALVVALLYVFVMPKYFELLRDFNIAIPPLTLFVRDTWNLVAWPLTICVVVAVLLYVGRMLAAIFAPASVVRGGPVSDALGVLSWYAPALGGMTRWRSLADACHVIADALEAGHPLDRALVEASRTGTNAVMASRLADWADLARAGMPAAEGARRAAMPPLLAGLLRTVTGGEIVDVFRFLARYYDSRFARTAVLLHAAMVPAMTILMGVVVAVVARSLFDPLIALLDELSKVTWSFR
jgi:type IV pilus assembly protein PilC